MTKVRLTNTWQEVVTSGQEYLLQSIGSYSYYIADSAAQPTNDNGFKLSNGDSLSSAVYPANNGIWAKAITNDVNLLVDTWA